ncbi:MAG: DUF4279 domain-containing protein [Cyanobacteria bacterium J06627_3]
MSDSPPSDTIQISGPEDNFGRPSAYESAVSLRFWGEALVPDEITQALGVQPQIAHGKGESLSPSLMPTAPIGIWIYFANESVDRPLDDNILSLLQQLPQELDIWHCLTDQHSGIISCGLRFDQQDCGQFLSAATLEKVGERRLAIDFDLKFDPAEF